jgi:hypothetical protein
MKLKVLQKKKLEKHKVHHSKKHIDLMKKLMMGGMTFNDSHKVAQSLVGK